MHISETGLTLVKSFEGKYLKAYKCPAGVWTIGYGHTGKVDGKSIASGMTITSSKADLLLKEDMRQHEQYVEKYVKLKLNQNQFDALTSFCFNCGPGNLKTLITGRNEKQIAEAILKYNKANGKELAGLTRRRKAERELFLKSCKKTYTGKFPSAVVKKGAANEQVKLLQAYLNWYGSYKLTVDGLWGTKTESAVIDFQKKEKLVADGVFGPASLKRAKEIVR